MEGSKNYKKISYNSSTKFSSHHEGPPTANLHTVPSGKESLLKRADGSKVNCSNLRGNCGWEMGGGERLILRQAEESGWSLK